MPTASPSDSSGCSKYCGRASPSRARRTSTGARWWRAPSPTCVRSSRGSSRGPCRCVRAAPGEYRYAGLSRRIARYGSRRSARIMKTGGSPGRWLIILPPLVFLLVFFLIPFAFAFKISFAEAIPHVPPFSDVISFTPEHHLQVSAHLGNYKYLLTDQVYLFAYLYSLRTAFFSTL